MPEGFPCVSIGSLKRRSQKTTTNPPSQKNLETTKQIVIFRTPTKNNKQTNKQTDRQTDKKTDRQTNKHHQSNKGRKAKSTNRLNEERNHKKSGEKRQQRKQTKIQTRRSRSKIKQNQSPKTALQKRQRKTKKKHKGRKTKHPLKSEQTKSPKKTPNKTKNIKSRGTKKTCFKPWQKKRPKRGKKITLNQEAKKNNQKKHEQKAFKKIQTKKTRSLCHCQTTKPWVISTPFVWLYRRFVAPSPARWMWRGTAQRWAMVW